jgi:hypothetical protein
VSTYQLEARCWVTDPDGRHYDDEEEALNYAGSDAATVLAEPCWVAKCDGATEPCGEPFGDDDEGYYQVHAPTRRELETWLRDRGWTVAEDGAVQCDSEEGHE